MHRRVENTDVETTRTSQRGVYSGATQAFMAGEDALPAPGPRSPTARFWVIEAVEFGERIRDLVPDGHAPAGRADHRVAVQPGAVGQRERLLSLGRLSAGLTHELNNPAAAAVRATASLRERVSRMRGKLAHLASGKVDAAALRPDRGAGGGRGADGQGPGDVDHGGQRPRGHLADWLDDHA